MWRPNTLFSRLVIAQAVTVVTVVALLGSLFYVDRNRALARLVAERWAPTLRAAGGGEAPPTPMPPAMAVHRQLELPPLSVRGAERLPRLQVLRDSLRAQGLAVEEMAFSQSAPSPLVWARVRQAGGELAWLGFEDDLIEPGWPQRALLVLLITLALPALASWWIAGWIAGPLVRLRDRMAAYDPAQPGPPVAPTPDRAATVEVTDIESAWHALGGRLARHQAERQLLLAGVSHDLRSPLSRIRLSAELLPTQPGVSERRDAIVRNVDVADSLLGSFLDLVRAGTLPLDETVDLATLARDLADGWGHPGQSFEVQAPDTLPLAGANAVLLERALLNLLDNAFRYGKPPVLLRVGGSVREPWLEVVDSGAGIPVQDRERMLQAFSRGDASRGKPGTGLGLAVVAEVVGRLGGRLEFDADGGRHVIRLRLHGAGGRGDAS